MKEFQQIANQLNKNLSVAEEAMVLLGVLYVFNVENGLNLALENKDFDMAKQYADMKKA